MHSYSGQNILQQCFLSFESYSGIISEFWRLNFSDPRSSLFGCRKQLQDLKDRSGEGFVSAGKAAGCYVHVQFANCVLRQAGCSSALKSQCSLCILADTLHLGWLVISEAHEDPTCGQTLYTMLLTIFSNAASPSDTRIPSEALSHVNASHQLHWKGFFIKLSLASGCIPSPWARRWDSQTSPMPIGNPVGKNVESSWWKVVCSLIL